MLTSEMSDCSDTPYSSTSSNSSKSSLPSHSIISPAILYFGTPVAIISSLNEDLTTNLAAISSVFWLGHRCVLGFGATSQTPINLRARKQCVVNLPDDTMAGAINALATTTGTPQPSASKLARGYRFVRDKWAATGLTPQDAAFVAPQRVRECPVQLECEVVAELELLRDLPDLRGALVVLEARVLRVHVVDALRLPGHANRIDPDRWRPLIMSFQQLYGLAPGRVAESVLGRVDEEKYRLVTRSRVVKLDGDDDKEIVEQEFKVKS